FLDPDVLAACCSCGDDSTSEEPRHEEDSFSLWVRLFVGAALHEIGKAQAQSATQMNKKQEQPNLSILPGAEHAYLLALHDCDFALGAFPFVFSSCRERLWAGIFQRLCEAMEHVSATVPAANFHASFDTHAAERAPKTTSSFSQGGKN
ncbi:unnamed protein product, partial [Amoebophrya sp. A120]